MASAGNEEGEFGLQIAPLLDVLFVLLLFFMVSAGVQEREAELSSNLPSVGQATPGTEKVPVQIEINSAGQVYYNKNPIDTPTSEELPALKSRLETIIGEFGEQPVIITPEPETRHKRVIHVLNACSAARVKNVAFGTKAR